MLKEMRNRLFNGRALVVLLVTGLFLGIAAVSQGTKLQRIEDRSTVCMLKNRTLGRPFIPVVVDGKTYYGCCEMCTGTLQKIRKERFAIDPVTGKTVDKSKAIIGALPDGAVLYFENEKSFLAFSR